jgi:hypothetical protein
MSSRLPPRYLPTLTEVVDPTTLASDRAAIATEPVASMPVAAEAPTPVPVPVASATPASTHFAAPVTAVPDKHALAQQLIKLVRPQLEAELRNIAQELFEAQFSALLPSMHLHIEEAVREAIEQALPEHRDINN